MRTPLTSSRAVRALAVVTLVASIGCARNPVSGNVELSLVSEQQEIAIGRQSRDETLATIGRYKDPQAQALVERIGMEIAKASERPNLPWEFHVIDDPQVNAFAAPGGFIFITRGIMAHMNSEAELASVLGHEVGHVTARHSAQQITRMQVAQLGLGVGMILSPTIRNLGGALSQGMQVLFLKFGRDAEMQADDLGLAYMVADGYDPRDAVTMFRTLGRVGARDGQRLPEWASTHPDPGTRVAATQRRLAALTAKGVEPTSLKRGDDEYLQLLDGMMFGPNPRAGYFVGDAFYHPDLRFAFTFPEGWKRANLPDRVVAQAPQGNALLQLRLAKGSPQEAARQFFTQQGLQVGGTRQGSVNGLQTVAGDFATQLEDGTAVSGAAAFLAHQGQTYMLLGVAAQREASEVRARFEQLLRSFRPLTDPAALDVKPAVVRVVRLSRDMTVQEFHAAHRSSASVADLALLNGQDGAASLMRAGTLGKYVSGGVGSNR